MVINIKSHLAALTWTQDRDFERAAKMYMELIKIIKKIHGRDDESIIMMKGNLAGV